MEIEVWKPMAGGQNASQGHRWRRMFHEAFQQPHRVWTFASAVNKADWRTDTIP